MSMLKTFDEVVVFARTGLNPRDNFKLGFGNNKYITIKNIYNNRINVDDNTDVVDDEAIKLIHKRSQIKKGDVLFCSIGRLGDMCVIEEDPIGWDINESVFAFTLNLDVIRQKYFYYVFKNHNTIEYLTRNSSGSTFKSIKMNQLKKMTFDLPSLTEQDHIVDVLDNVASVIELRKKQLQSLDELIKARFVEMFGDPINNPLRWAKEAFENNATLVNGRAYKQDELLESGKYPVLRVGNFFSNRGWYYSDLELDENKYCENGDLLYAWSASFGPQIWNGEKVIYHYHIWKVLVGNAYNKLFLCNLLAYVTDYLMSDTHGIAMMHLTKSGMEKTEFIVPPIELQNEFAVFVKEVDKSKVVVQKALDEAQLLFDSLMQEYFG